MRMIEDESKKIMTIKVNGALKGKISYEASTYLHGYAERNSMSFSAVANNLDWAEELNIKMLKEQLKIMGSGK